MILLNGADHLPPWRIAIFGAGLIGTATARAIFRRYEPSQKALPFDWNDPFEQERQLCALESELSRFEADASGAPPLLALLWSAGRAGFNAVDAETAPELRSFRAVLDLAVRLAARGPVTFHLVSSAGGLYEGQRQVASDAIPSPRRAYGRLKQMQEEMLGASSLRTRIYRPSTVYGFVRQGQRIGLVSLLVLNAIRHRVTHINGRMSTLRDFAFADDIGDFLAQSIVADVEAPALPPVILAQGKPASIFEVRRVVESVVGHPIYVSYSLSPDNAEDTTFAPAALPPAWKPSDLASNVRRIYRHAVASGVAFSFPQSLS